jgi:hypothetical protein
MNTSCQKGCKHVHTHLSQRVLAPMPKPPSPLTFPQIGRIKHVQKVAGSILYYARAVDMTVLKALSSIAVEQTKVTEQKWHDANNY